MPDQTPEQVVDISLWPLDEEFGIFPVGSKPKRAVFCPTPAPYPFLIAGHRYLFKVSKDWRILQHWSEVTAYALARSVNMSAAPCFIAVDSDAGEVGVLVEFSSQALGGPLITQRVDRHHRARASSRL